MPGACVADVGCSASRIALAILLLFLPALKVVVKPATDFSLRSIYHTNCIPLCCMRCGRGASRTTPAISLLALQLICPLLWPATSPQIYTCRRDRMCARLGAFLTLLTLRTLLTAKPSVLASAPGLTRKLLMLSRLGAEARQRRGEHASVILYY